MKRMISWAIAALVLLPTTASAQKATEKERSVKAYVKADFISHYMWRGMDLADISIQPTAGISWKGLTLEASGNAGFNKDDIQEIDVTLSFEKWGFNIGVTDYWATGTDSEERYFYYNSKKGAHQFEGNIGYTCKYGSLQAYTMFGGNDFKVNGERAFSTFIEFSIPFRLGGLDWDARVGVTPFESAGDWVRTYFEAGGSTHYLDQDIFFYGEGFTCNMASIRATKTLEFNHFKLPVFAEFHANPYLQKARFLVGISIEPF